MGPVAGINEYESFAVGFDNKVMNEVGIVDKVAGIEVSMVVLPS
jgi:hypothetical protein